MRLLVEFRFVDFDDGVVVTILIERLGVEALFVVLAAVEGLVVGALVVLVVDIKVGGSFDVVIIVVVDVVVGVVVLVGVVVDVVMVVVVVVGVVVDVVVDVADVVWSSENSVIANPFPCTFPLLALKEMIPSVI